MVWITYIAHDGTTNRVDVASGSSVMQGAIDHAIGGILAECGGACSCGTCHCYVDPAWSGRVGPPDAIEEQMLEFAIDPQPNSRLSCQIAVTEALDGLVVRLPESQV